MHLDHDRGHAFKLFGVGADNQVGTFDDRFEGTIGDDHRDLDDHFGRRVEARHLQIDPDERLSEWHGHPVTLAAQVGVQTTY